MPEQLNNDNENPIKLEDCLKILFTGHYQDGSGHFEAIILQKKSL